MRAIVVSDIWGATEPFKKLCEDIGKNVIAIDPYNGIDLQFSDEQQAYQHFSAHIGLEQYTKLVFQKITQHKQPCILIGFSVGASAIWNISPTLNEHQVAKAYCFYGGQIRHKTNLIPSIKTELILPYSEPHFDQNEMLKDIKKKDNIKIQHTQYFHGFLNQLSNNFNQQGYDKYIEYIQVKYFNTLSMD